MVDRTRPLTLASGSVHRARLLEAAGIEFRVEVPDVDERAFDHLFDPTDPATHAVRLASAKARRVGSDHTDSGALILAADQLAIADGAMLSKPSSAAAAVEQLVSLSGTTHELVNGLVVLDVVSGVEHVGVDINQVTMTRFDRRAAEAYVTRFMPLDAVGAYRLEDDAGLIAHVDGTDDGVIGLPIALVRDLRDRFG